jgi:hypothetical protein
MQIGAFRIGSGFSVIFQPFTYLYVLGAGHPLMASPGTFFVARHHFPPFKRM